MPRTLEEILGSAPGQQQAAVPPVAQQHGDGPGFFGAIGEGFKGSPTGMLMYGIPEPGTEDYDFWEKVGRGLGENLDPISLGLFLAGGGIGGAVAKKLGVKAVVEVAKKAGAKQAVKAAMANIATRGITGATQFGLQGAGAEGIRQAVAKDPDLARLLRETAKSAAVGATVGPASAVPGKGLIGSIPRLAAETTAITGAGAMLNGQKFTPEDFLVNAAVIGASKATSRPFERAAGRAAEKVLADEIRKGQVVGEDAYKELRPNDFVEPSSLVGRQRGIQEPPPLQGPTATGEPLPNPLSAARRTRLAEEQQAKINARREPAPPASKKSPIRRVIEYEPGTGLGESMGDWFASKWIDERSPLRKMAAAVEKATGGKVKALHDPFMLARTRFADASEAAYLHIRERLDPITQGMTEAEFRRLGEHVTARAIDAQRSEHPDAFRELMQANGLDDDTIHSLMRTGPEELASNGKSMEQMAQEISAYNWELAVTLLGEARAKALWGEKGFYSPLFRERMATDSDTILSPDEMATLNFGVGPAEVPLGEPLRRLKGGGDRKLSDPFASILAQTVGLYRYARQQEVGQAMARLAQTFDIAEVAKIVDKPGPNTIEVATDKIGGGKNVHVQVDPQIYHAYANMGKSTRAMFGKVLTAPTKVLRAGATLAPEFWIRNVGRDVFSAMIYSKNGFTPLDFVRGMASSLKQDQWYKEWVESGGANASMAAMDKHHLLRRHIEYIKTGPRAAVERTVYHPLQALRMMSSLAEDATRIGEYRKARSKGKDTITAAFEARDLTIDFARMGEYGRHMNSIVAFWNAQVSGYEKLYRELGKQWVTNPKQAAAVTSRAMTLITLPSAALVLQNMRDPRWKDIPDWQKNAFWIIMWPGSKYIWRIPKPFDLGVVFSSPIERALEAMVKDDPSQWGKLVEAFGSTAADVVPGSPADFTALGPIIEVMQNKSQFTGGRIVPRHLEDFPPELQTKKWTSRTAKAFGEAFGYSPAKAEYLWNGYTASLGRYVNDASDTALNLLDPKDVPKRPSEDIPFASVPILRNIMRGFTSRVGAGQVYDDYADALGENEEKWRARKELRMRPRDAAEVERIHRIGLATDKQITAAWKRIDQIEASKLLSPDEKRRKVDEQYMKISEIAGRSLQKIRQR